VTIVKLTVNQDLIKEFIADELVGEYLEDGREDAGICDRFQPGQEFIIEHPFSMPEGFCPWAWADIRQDILSIAMGGNIPWMKREGMKLSGCSDWFRPVYFKIERLD
jgi:uncharacterized repeat protein (TIGR04076 family)